MRVSLALAGLALGLAGCTPHAPPPARAALDCPERAEILTRTAVAADGRSCAYKTADGDQVSLRLIPVSGGVDAALAPIERELAAETATPGGRAASSATASAEADRVRSQAAADAGAGPSAKAKQDTDADTKSDNDDDKSGAADRLNVELPGIHVSADDTGANVHVAGIDVDAGEGGAVVRSTRTVRLRGEAFSRLKRGFRASYVLARDDLPNGLKEVGYEAAGPRTGPLAVAIVRMKNDDHDKVYHAAKALVTRNGDV